MGITLKPSAIKKTSLSGVKEKSNRFEFIDLAKGICIILVVFYHTCAAGPEPLKTMLVSFRMPLYFFLSGIFFSRYGGIKEFCLKKFNKLIVPFCGWWLISFAVIACKQFFLSKGLQWEHLKWFFSEDFRFNGPLWFLFCLFECGLVFYFVVFLSDKYKSELVFFALSIFLGLVGFYLGKYQIDIPFWLDTALTALPFYACGYFLRRKTNFLATTKGRKYYIPLSLLLFLVTYFAPYSQLIFNDTSKANPVLFYFCGISGTLAVLFFSKALNRLPVVSYWGRYSICILVTHLIVNNQLLVPLGDYITKTLDVPIQVSRVFCFLLLMFSYLYTIPFMLKYLPHICAQKPVIPEKGHSDRSH